MKLHGLFRPCDFRIVGDGEPNLDQVADYVSKNLTNEKVAGFLNKVRPINDDAVSGYLEKDENGKKLANKLFDTRVNDAVQNHDKKFQQEKLPGLLAAERERVQVELNKKETPEAKDLRESKERIARLEQENKTAKLRSQALEIINEAKLPFAKIVDKFIGEDVDSTVKNIQAFKEIWDTELTAKAKELAAKGSGRDPNARDDDKPLPLQTQLEAAQKAKNLLEVIRLKNLIAEEANAKK